MRIEKQLALFLENRPGILAEVCGLLTKAGINILALAVLDTIDHAVVRMVVSDAKQAKKELKRAGIQTLENEVLYFEVPNRVGILGTVASRLSQAKINIEYIYATADEQQRSSSFVLRTRDVKEAMRVLAPLRAGSGSGGDD